MLPLKRSAQEKKGTLAEKPFLCYYDIYRKERRENNEKLYSGNVSEETFCKETHLGNSCGDRHGICSVMAGAGQFWNRPLHEHESCYYIGFGTLANMFLVGYSIDFFSWVWSKVLPDGLFDSMAVRLGVLLPALAVFVVAAGVYMVTELGTAPYDAIPFLIVKAQKKVPFRVVRMVFDFTVIVIAWVFGAKIGLVTILMGFTLGPVISWVGEKMAPFFNE